MEAARDRDSMTGLADGAASSPSRARSAAQSTAESLATRVLRHVPALTDRLVGTIRTQNPGYRKAGFVPVEDLWQSCHDNITRVLQMLAEADADREAGPHTDPDADLSPGPAPDDEYYDAARDTGRRRAEQGLPLDDVLRSFRLGGRLIWEALIEEARSQGVGETDGLLDVGSRVWAVVDESSAQVALAYHAAEKELVRADEQVRARVWEGLLAGHAKDPAFALEAATLLGVPVEGRYAVVVADRRTDEPDVARTLGPLLRFRGIESRWQSRPDVVVGLLAIRDATLERPLRFLRESLEVSAGVSFVVTGLAGVETAFRQATLALRTVGEERGQVFALEQRLPEALLLNSLDLAESLVRSWLGPLMALPEPERGPLLDTLETWVATAGSTGQTAAVVHCHRNTVVNRMRRIQEITGHDVTTGTPSVELSLALRARRLLSWR